MTEGESKFWMFTINNPLNNDFENIDYEYLVWQLEIGEKEGTVHAQGYICFETNHKFKRVQNLFYENGEHKPHLEKRKGKHSEAKGYCSKSETRLDGPFYNGNDKNISEGSGSRSDLIDIRNKIDNGIPEKIIWSENFSSYTRYYKGFREYKTSTQKEKKLKEQIEKYHKDKITLLDWQKLAIDTLLAQDDRKVLWCYGTKGEEGKTFLGKYIKFNYNAFYCRGGKVSDVNHAYNYEDIIVFDFTRDSKEFINYTNIEHFKDGMIWSGKYESQMKITNNCKVIVFSNQEPDREKMSKDRWEVMKLKTVDDSDDSDDGNKKKYTIK